MQEELPFILQVLLQTADAQLPKVYRREGLLEQCDGTVVRRKVDTGIRHFSEEDDSRGELQRKTRTCSDKEER